MAARTNRGCLWRIVIALVSCVAVANFWLLFSSQSSNSFLSSGTTDRLLNDSPRLSPRENIHVVYQVACSAYSLHQAIALDWSWAHVAHPGRLSRIVCGCETSAEKERLLTSPLEGDKRFTVFFSAEWNDYVPNHYPEAKGDTYHAYNHPFGFNDWLATSPPAEEYIVYMEPDMVFTKPILHHVPEQDGGQSPKVELGSPVGQYYHYVAAWCPPPCGAADPGWMEFASPELCGENCPVDISEERNRKEFALGPPTIMHRRDWQALAPLWCNYSVAIRTRAVLKSDGLGWLKSGQKVYIAEMLAYSLAAATLRLSHRIVHDLAVDSMGEIPKSYNSPRILHYCYPQNTLTPDGYWIWNKYRMPIGYGGKGEEQWRQILFWDCDVPLLQEPGGPENLKLSAWEKGFGRGPYVLWMIRKIIQAYNEGTSSVKARRCQRYHEKMEVRKLILVTEDFPYIASETLKADELPLTERAQSLVRSNVHARAWK
eukprot:TRINITY_DN24450_c0_g1_i1.p1 TRINITY_DN24450_c0_g1~~TRINITY_DN24450_c0_g1_i1.p1  ORF type:complete len:485 (+),score=45.79 TRINITY_DN24450_c0_g1_i1:50-1504(+)